MTDNDTNKRVRFWKRDHGGKPWLNDIEIEAEKHGLSLREAADMILQKVVSKKMLKDLLRS
jgi:hypothetical protein